MPRCERIASSKTTEDEENCEVDGGEKSEDRLMLSDVTRGYKGTKSDQSVDMLEQKRVAAGKGLDQSLGATPAEEVLWVNAVGGGWLQARSRRLPPLRWFGEPIPGRMIV